MDTKRLETIRITALQHVQRCRPTYPSSTTCRYGHERSLLRLHEPWTPKCLRYRRFVFKVTPDSEGAAPIYAFDLLQAAIDAALLELLLDGCTKRLAGFRAFVEEANKAMRPGPQNRIPRQRVANRRSRSGVLRSMKLTERKHIFIDISRSQHPEATYTSPPEHLSLMQTVLNLDSVVERGCRVHSLGAVDALSGSIAFSRFLQYARRIYMT